MNQVAHGLPAFAARSYEFAEYAPARNWIGGAWVDPSTGAWAPVENPRHGRAMSKVAMSGAADVDAAVEAAAAAQREWRAWPVRERAQVMFRLKALMERDREELAWLISHENGKVYAEALAEVDKGIECAEFGCSLENLAAGEQLYVSRGVNCRESYEPLGVVAGVTPFNFPVMVPLWMLPQALVAGNAFILKASEVVPLGALKLAVLLREAGLPDGVFNLVHGGADVVNALADHPGIRALAFVGSTKVAKLVYARGAAQGKAVLCLGGAKNHLIVVPDADVQLTAANVAASFTGCAGQRCMAASVLVAVGEVDHIVRAVAGEAAKLRLGHEMGPVISEAAEARIRGYIDGAEAAGANILLDGRPQRGEGGGYWVGPTILDGVAPSMKAACDEIFGPVISVIRVRTLDEALAIENANPYGNAACIYTTSGAVAEYVVERVDAGMVGVNVGVPVPREPFGFGGWNDSRFGHGNITGWDGFLFWTRPRKVTTKWALQKDTTWMG